MKALASTAIANLKTCSNPARGLTTPLLSLVPNAVYLAFTTVSVGRQEVNSLRDKAQMVR